MKQLHEEKKKQKLDEQSCKTRAKQLEEERQKLEENSDSSETL